MKTAKPKAPPPRPESLGSFTNTIVDKITMVPTISIKRNKRRSRTHDDHQIALVMGSFKAFGLINPLVVDEHNVLLAGHARHEAAKRLGIPELPVVCVSHLSEDEKRAYVVADNQIATKAGWDLEVLAEELQFLTSIEMDIDVLGFSTAEIDIIIDGAKEDVHKADEADTIPDAVSGPAVSRLGDVWLLGRHRLICGSALDDQAYAALMGIDKARMVLSDPPYNVEINGFVSGLGKVQHREFAMASGEMSRDEFTTFLRTAFGHAGEHLIDGGLAYYFMDWRGSYAVMEAAQELGLKPYNLCVWDKTTGGMGSHYRSQHELCWVYKKGTAPHINTVELGRHGRYRTNVWRHPGLSSYGRERDASLAMHPTVKPVNLLVEAIKDCTRRGDIVLDPFLGSGSTLIAAEKCGRIGYGIELDPLYIDTIVRRFSQVSCIQAVHEGSGKRFAELAELRLPQPQEATGQTDSQAPERTLAASMLANPAEPSRPDMPFVRPIRPRPRPNPSMNQNDEISHV